MGRATSALLALASLLWALSAQAKVTYCVGGYEGTPPGEVVAACDLPAVRVGRSFRVPEQAVHDYLRAAFIEAG